MSEPVEIVHDRSGADDEGLILRFAEDPLGTRIELVLSAGESAYAVLDGFAVEWQELRVGDIVWVRPSDAARRPGPG